MNISVDLGIASPLNIDPSLTVRKFQWDDVPALVEHMNYVDELDKQDGRATVEEIQHEWSSPEFNPEKECYVVYNAEGKLVAYALTENPYKVKRAYGGLSIDPVYRESMLGVALIRLTDRRFIEDVKDVVPADEPIWVQRWSPDTIPYYIKLYESEGYQLVRKFYRMMIDLSAPREPVKMPEGFEIRPFVSPDHEHEVYRASADSFQDHWGSTDPGFESWRHYRIENPRFTPDMWYIAWDGDRVAGVALCEAWGDDIPEMGFVNLLGVRREYRKRGLGEALLKHAFYEFQQKGFTQGGLGVDASSKTNAVALYERAGMHVHKSSSVLFKMYRGKFEDVKA